MDINTSEVSAPKPSYPYNSLDDALKVGQAVLSAGGASTDVTKSTLAQRLGTEESSAFLAQRIASARCFGVIEGRGSVRLTQAGAAYFNAPSGGGRAQLLEFFGSPKVFKALIAIFDGKRLPDDSAVSAHLRAKEELGTNWAGRVAATFRRSVEGLGLLDPNGIMRYRFNVESASASSSQKSSTETPKSPDSSAGSLPLPWSLAKTSGANPSAIYTTWRDGDVQVITPETLTRKQWEKLSRYIQVLEPEKE